MSFKDVPKIDTVSEAIQLIEKGTQAVSKNKDIEDIVLMIGNTGAGKSTVSRLLASPEDLESERVIDRCIIRDKGERISCGEDTTVSKTLFPELLQDPETGTAFYDLPGFCDTRNESVEIANAFCMKAVADQAKRVKLLFVINHSSLLTGETRLDLTAFLAHSADFIKSPKKFMDGIALVATKVRGETEEVIPGIVNFLTVAKKNLKAVIAEDAPRRAAEEIINAILTKDLSDNYARIAYFREPKESGPVQQIKSVMKDRAKIYSVLQSNLDYCNSSPDDFGLSVSPQAQFVVLRIADQTQQSITETMNKVGNRLEAKIASKVQNCDFTALGTLWNGNKSFEASIKVLQSNPNIRWRDFLRNFFQLFRGFNENGVLEKEFGELKQAQTTLEFSEKLGGCKFPTRVLDWTIPFHRLGKSTGQAIVQRFSSFFTDTGMRFLELIKRITKSLERKKGACSDDRYLGQLYEQYANWSHSLVEELYAMKSVNQFIEQVQSCVRALDADISTSDLVKLENDVEFENVSFNAWKWLKPFEVFETKRREEHSLHTLQSKSKEDQHNLQRIYTAQAEAQKIRMEQMEAKYLQKIQEQNEQFYQKSQDQEKEIEAMKKEIRSQQKENSVRWVPMSGGRYPEDAFVAGMDNGNNLYVARASYEGSVVPGKLHETHLCAYIPYGSKELGVNNYEVLVARPSSLSWVTAKEGEVPFNALKGGWDCASHGETYYIGRVEYNGTVTVGKIHPSHRVCYIPYGGKELKFEDYEVLVQNVGPRDLGA